MEVLLVNTGGEFDLNEFNEQFRPIVSFEIINQIYDFFKRIIEGKKRVSAIT